METPSSASKISPNSGNGGFNSSISRIALFDISNDSPVVGLTLGTPAGRSSFKISSRLELDEINVNDQLSDEIESGEALLRRQVKSLLRSIEEEECSYEDEDDHSFDDSISVFPVRLLAPGNHNKEEEEAVLRSHNNAATTTTTKDLWFDFFGDKYHGAMFSNQEQIPRAR